MNNNPSPRKTRILQQIAQASTDDQLDILNDITTQTLLKSIVVIAGTGRCGTSWLQDWLLQHPNTYGIYHETNLFFHFARFGTPSEEDGMLNCFTRLGLNRQQYHNMVCKIAYQIITDQNVAKDYVNSRGHAKLNWRPTFQGLKRNVFVEKTPHNVLCINEIYEMMAPYTKVYTLHIYRDGRNYLESALRCKWDHMTPQQHTQRWIMVMNKMIKNQFPANTMHIKYEDLVANPESSKEISEHVQLAHTSDIKPFGKPVQMDEHQGIPKFDTERYKTLHGNPQIVKCYKEMKPILNQLGYPT